VASRRPTASCRDRLRREHGNTLVLFPAAVLIVLGLGGLALDSATIFLGQRRLADLAAALANDAVAAVDQETFLGVGDLTLAQERISARQTQLIASQAEDRGFESIDCAVELDPDPLRAVAVCSAQVRPLFSPLLPGIDRVEQVRVVEAAVPAER
jgi:hypothetical protein